MASKTEYIQERVRELEHHNESDEIAGYLRMYQGGDFDREERIPLHYGANLVGGTIGNSILLKGRGVSTFHAIIQIEKSPHLAFLEDLHSTNGTSISISGQNDDFKLIPKRLYQILNDQEITFGPTRCLFQSVMPTAPTEEGVGGTDVKQPEYFPELKQILSFQSPAITRNGIDESAGGDQSREESMESSQIPLDENCAKENTEVVMVVEEEAKDSKLEIPSAVEKMEESTVSEISEEKVTSPPLIPSKRASAKQKSFESKVAKIDEERDVKNESALSAAGITLKVIKKPTIPALGPSKVKPPLRRKPAAPTSQQQTQETPTEKVTDMVSADESITDEEELQRLVLAEKAMEQIENPTAEKLLEEQVESAVEELEESMPKARGRKKKSAPVKGKENKPIKAKAPRVSKAGPSKLMKSASSFSASTPSTSRSRRSKAETKAVRVLISVTDKSSANAFEKIIKKLDGECVENVADCTHMISDKVKRTIKFLGCVSQGKFIVSSEWLDESVKSNSFADPWQFLVSDAEGEERFGFNLKESLLKTTPFNAPKLLEGYTVYATISVVPKEDDLKTIVADAGGFLVIDPPDKNQSKFLIIGHENDITECAKLKSLGFSIYKVDLILTGILRQSLELKSKVFKLEL